MAGSSNTLRAVLTELGWSRTRLVAELRRQAARSGESLPGTESLLAMVSRWVNNHQQPSDFYRDLLARTLGRPRAELFSDETARLELAAEAEPCQGRACRVVLGVGLPGRLILGHPSPPQGRCASLRDRLRRPCPGARGPRPRIATSRQASSQEDRSWPSACWASST
jgi:hypothetical protein